MSVLKTRKEVDNAMEALRLTGLPLHAEPEKNWDTWLAINFVRKAGLPDDAAIMDAGGESYSNFAPALKGLGYTNLTVVNLVYDPQWTWLPDIHYTIGDITDTHLPAASIDLVFCQSVIEHGVNLSNFLAEQARIIRPGGHLLISTDFWCSPVDTSGISMYGQPWTIFSPARIDVMQDIARGHSFDLVGGPMSYDCGEAMYHLMGRDYTFIFFALRRTDRQAGG